MPDAVQEAAPGAPPAHFVEAWSRLDPQLAAVIRAVFARWGSTPPVFELDPAEARRAISRLQLFWSAGAPALPHVEERVIAGASGPVRIRLYDPGAPAPAPAVAFLHGGGWVLCDIDLYDGVARQLAVRSGLRVLSVDYGLAPEHPFPAGLGDCVAALRWAAAEGAAAFGVDPARLAVAGDSAGANLALAACLALRDEGGPLPRGAALVYGAFSEDGDTPSGRAYGDGAYLLTTAEMRWYWSHYVPDQAARGDPLAAPLHADLAGLPPLLVMAAEFDPLRDDSEALVRRLREIGAPVESRLMPRMTHACLNLMGFVDAVGPELDRVGAFLRRVTAAP
ncbi:MAG TPA: alpha/beta hydrolase [Microvirga sp.]|nr:alpha/beta hydrolase [Microvirga sp.]